MSARRIEQVAVAIFGGLELLFGRLARGDIAVIDDDAADARLLQQVAGDALGPADACRPCGGSGTCRAPASTGSSNSLGDQLLPGVAIDRLDQVAHVDADEIVGAIAEHVARSPAFAHWITPSALTSTIASTLKLTSSPRRSVGRRVAHQSAAFISAIAISTLPRSSSTRSTSASVAASDSARRHAAALHFPRQVARRLGAGAAHLQRVFVRVDQPPDFLLFFRGHRESAFD